MYVGKLYSKIKAKTWQKIVSFFKPTKYYFLIYKSYYHYKFLKPKSSGIFPENFYTAVPNPGAGIGHQLANWIAGYWFARYFNLTFAHTPIVSSTWEFFLGFGESEKTAFELIRKHGYKKVKLPLFDEKNLQQVKLIRKIIASYQNKKVVFEAEQDQFYTAQFEVINDLKRKFYTASARMYDKLIYSPDHFNIAVHIRRGDITAGLTNNNPNLTMRWQNNTYFVNVLADVLKKLTQPKSVYIYIFSQSTVGEMQEFNQFENITFCLDMDARTSFLHMVYADLLVTSKSGFSYKAALLNNNIKVCPGNFWHGYPSTPDFILTDENGDFEKSVLL